MYQARDESHDNYMYVGNGPTFLSSNTTQNITATMNQLVLALQSTRLNNSALSQENQRLNVGLQASHDELTILSNTIDLLNAKLTDIQPIVAASQNLFDNTSVRQPITNMK